jgi:hypothetical protein
VYQMSATHCYVGHADCGCLVSVVVDDPEYKKDTAKSVAQFIRSGYAVTRITLEEFRAVGKWGHQCIPKRFDI